MTLEAVCERESREIMNTCKTGEVFGRWCLKVMLKKLVGNELFIVLVTYALSMMHL